MVMVMVIVIVGFGEDGEGTYIVVQQIEDNSGPWIG
jgi:hypothetical protein